MMILQLTKYLEKIQMGLKDKALFYRYWVFLLLLLHCLQRELPLLGYMELMEMKLLPYLIPS